MKSIPILFLISTFPIITPFLLELTPKRSTHCYTKVLDKEDHIYYSFLVSASKNKKLKAEFKNLKTNIIISKHVGTSIEYKSDLLQPGEYEICFKPKDKGEKFYVSFQFYSFSENGILKDIANNTELKYMSQGVNELKESFQNFETNFKYIVDRRTKHNQILDGIIASIKNLTLLKICVVLVLSIFQVFIIEKFFGPDKRVSSLKGAFSQKL